LPLFVGDVAFKESDRLFTSAFVLLGAGIVGALFGIFSGDVMEFQVTFLYLHPFSFSNEGM